MIMSCCGYAEGPAVRTNSVQDYVDMCVLQLVPDRLLRSACQWFSSSDTVLLSQGRQGWWRWCVLCGWERCFVKYTANNFKLNLKQCCAAGPNLMHKLAPQEFFCRYLLAQTLRPTLGCLPNTGGGRTFEIICDLTYCLSARSVTMAHHA